MTPFRRTLRVRRPQALLAGILLSLAACGGDGGTEPSPPDGLKYIAGAEATDTVDAVLPQALVVEVHDAQGALAVGTVVRFRPLAIDTVQNPYGGSYVRLGLLVSNPADNQFGDFASAAADDRGHASILLKFGQAAGQARLEVAVPELALLDTVTFVVKPGNAKTVQATPEDTALYAGGTAQLHAAVVDRYGNRRDDPVTYTLDSGPIGITASGKVTATGVGRGIFLAQGAGAVDTGYVSVVPHGTLAAVRAIAGSDSSELVAFDLDGTNLRVLTRLRVYNVPPSLTWLPGGTRLVFASGGMSPEYPHLWSVSASGGAATRFFASQPAGLTGDISPAFERDGSHLLFAGYADGSPSYALWRATSNGGSPMPLPGATGNFEWQPSPSPDGTRVAFSYASGGILVRTVADGSNSSWSVPGQTPRWSPTGDVIAYTNLYGSGAISTVNADGSNAHVVSSSGRAYVENSLAWSPDGAWLVARSAGGWLELIDPATGAFLPLGYTAGFFGPAWKP